MFTTRTLRSGRCSRSSVTAASTSSVGTSPAHASTTSGSLPSSFDAQSQMPIPRAQWSIGVLHRQPHRLGLLARDDDVHVIAAAQAVVDRGDEQVLASGGRYTRTTSAFLLTTRSMKPGSWCVKPLWSWRHTCEVSR